MLPIAFMILLAIYWFGRAFNIYGTINHAAREGAQISIAQTCADCTPGNAAPAYGNDCHAGDASTASFAHRPDANPCDRGAGLYGLLGRNSGMLELKQYLDMHECSDGPAPANSPPSSGTPACGTTVDFQYPYQMVLPFTSISNQAFKLPAHVQMRSEQ